MVVFFSATRITSVCLASSGSQRDFSFGGANFQNRNPNRTHFCSTFQNFTLQIFFGIHFFHGFFCQLGTAATPFFPWICLQMPALHNRLLRFPTESLLDFLSNPTIPTFLPLMKPHLGAIPAGCTPIPTWAPYEQSLYKPCIVGHSDESLENTINTMGTLVPWFMAIFFANWFPKISIFPNPFWPPKNLSTWKSQGLSKWWVSGL